MALCGHPTPTLIHRAGEKDASRKHHGISSFATAKTSLAVAASRTSVAATGAVRLRDRWQPRRRVTQTRLTTGCWAAWNSPHLAFVPAWDEYSSAGDWRRSIFLLRWARSKCVVGRWDRKHDRTSIRRATRKRHTVKCFTADNLWTQAHIVVQFAHTLRGSDNSEEFRSRGESAIRSVYEWRRVWRCTDAVSRRFWVAQRAARVWRCGSR